jgi:uncharacterized protein (TIGR00725 family)
MKPRIPIVGVIGSGTSPHAERASRLGRWLADKGVHLLTGGGGGVMASVSKAFYESRNRRGSVIGIVPCQEHSVSPKEGYPNPWVEISILTHLPLSGERGTDPLSRNHINILTSDVIVVLPGGSGTASEVALAISYQRPIIAFLKSSDEMPRLPNQVPIRTNLVDVCEFVVCCLEKRSVIKDSGAQS